MSLRTGFLTFSSSERSESRFTEDFVGVLLLTAFLVLGATFFVGGLESEESPLSESLEFESSSSSLDASFDEDESSSELLEELL